MANTLKSAFEKLTAHNHLLVFMGSSSILVKQIKRNLLIPFSLGAENQLCHTFSF